jgi:hypothetical protein
VEARRRTRGARPYEQRRACLDAWRVANPASWITDEFLIRQALAPELSAAEVLQLHAGVWAAGEYAWMTRDAWMSAAYNGTA